MTLRQAIAYARRLDPEYGRFAPSDLVGGEVDLGALRKEWEAESGSQAH